MFLVMVVNECIETGVGEGRHVYGELDGFWVSIRYIYICIYLQFIYLIDRLLIIII